MPENKSPKRLGVNYYNEDYFVRAGETGKGWYDKSAFSLDNLFHKEVTELFIEIAKPSKSDLILDIGCALGNVVYWLNKMGYNCRGIDISEYAIRHSHIPEQVCQCDIIDGLPYKDNQFDYIFSRETLEHIDKAFIPNVLKEIYRILKPGGAGLLMPANNFYGKETRKYNSKERDISHFCIRTPFWWARKCEEAGFRVDYKETLKAMCQPLCEKYIWTALAIVKDKL